MPLGVFNSLCSATMNISAWAFIVYSCVLGFARTFVKRISKGKVPRFLYIYANGAFGADVPQNIQQQ